MQQRRTQMRGEAQSRLAFRDSVRGRPSFRNAQPAFDENTNQKEQERVETMSYANLVWKKLAVAAVGVIALTVSSLAQANNATTSPVNMDPLTQQAGFGTKAKLALLYSPFNGVRRSIGIASVTNPSTGVYCMTPSVPINLLGIYPTVTVEWGESAGNAVMAFWRDTANGAECSTSQLEVMTFDFNSASKPVLSNQVSFVFVIE
jgi:hypothetical protein